MNGKPQNGENIWEAMQERKILKYYLSICFCITGNENVFLPQLVDKAQQLGMMAGTKGKDIF